MTARPPRNARSPGENGRPQYGLGAWELVYRFSFINLDSDNVLGGKYKLLPYCST